MNHILFCTSCKKYTLKKVCVCGEQTIQKKPLRYSPLDKFGEYRRKAKKEKQDN